MTLPPDALVERLKAALVTYPGKEKELLFVTISAEDARAILAALAAAPVPPATSGETAIVALARAWAEAEWRFTEAGRRFANSAYTPNSPGNVEIDAAYNKARQNHDTARLNLLAALSAPVPTLTEQARTISNAPICPKCSREVVTILNGCCVHCGTHFVHSLASEDR